MTNLNPLITRSIRIRVGHRQELHQINDPNPIHFVGHLAGAQVVQLLQQMLADKAFKGYESTSENWVLSVTSLSGAFNETTRTYLDGMQPENGRFMKPICLLQLCRIGVIIYDWIDIPWLKPESLLQFWLFSFFFCSLGVAAASSKPRGFARSLLPESLGLKREKITHLHFYFHDVVSGRNPTAIKVAAAASTNRSLTAFGLVTVMDDPLTETPETTSRQVGRVQGIYSSASQDDFSFLMVLNYAFTHGKYNGNTLSILGRNTVFSEVREMPVVGGLGFSGSLVAMLRQTPTLLTLKPKVQLWSIKIL